MPKSEISGYCKGCLHLGWAGKEPICDYLGQVGHVRPCPPGEGCTEHTRLKAPQGTQTVIKRKYARLDKERAKALYDAGLGDQRIAQELGVHKDTVCAWRRRNGLPSLPERMLEDKKMMKELAGTEETHETAAEMTVPAEEERLTVRQMISFLQRLEEFGLGDAGMSVHGRTVGDVKTVTVRLEDLMILLN